MTGKPFQSSLIPYRDEIFALRRNKPPVSYARIAEILQEKYGLTIQRAGINKFVKVRAKNYKPCKYAWDSEPANAKNRQTTETPPTQKQTVLQMSKPKVSAVENKPKSKDSQEASTFDPSKVEVTEYSATWNLHRPNTKEEREAYRQYLRNEKLKQQTTEEEN